MIDKKYYSEILNNLKNYKYTSIEHPEYDDYKNCDIFKMDGNNIILLDKSKNPIHIHWAINSITEFIEVLKELHGSFFINFVPKEFVKPLETVGFEILCEYMDLFNEDIKGTQITFNNYNDIKYLLPSEAGQAFKMSKLCQDQSRGFKGETEEWFENWIKENRVIVAKEGSKIIGYCCVSIYAEGTILWIREIAVDPQYQNKGFGNLLIQQAIFYGKMNGAKRGFLAADILNDHAIKLYKKYNFVPRIGESEIQMIKK